MKLWLSCLIKVVHENVTQAINFEFSLKQNLQWTGDFKNVFLGAFALVFSDKDLVLVEQKPVVMEINF